MIARTLNTALSAIESLSDEEYDACLDEGISPKTTQSALANIATILGEKETPLKLSGTPSVDQLCPEPTI